MGITASFKSGQIPSLNGWRAMAILLVILDHSVYTVGFPESKIPMWGWVVLQQGNLGVRIFFVLSGFLITHLLLQEAEERDAISIRNFFLRRCLRIFPVYFVYLGVLAMLLWLGVYYGESSSSWIGALTFTRNMVGPVASYTGHFWSLAVEEQFYLVWPLCLAAFALWRRLRLAHLLLLLPIVLCPIMRLSNINVVNSGEFYGRVFGSNSILVYADSLAVGCLGAFWVRRAMPVLSSAASSLVLIAALITLAAGAVLGLLGSMKGNMILAFIPSIQAFAVLIAMWISVQRPNSLTFRFLNWQPINQLGILSYSLYIWHVLFLCNITSPPLRALLYDWRTWWVAAITVATLSYYGVERPMLRLKKKKSLRWRSQ
ncbi:MAG TPA: acyltransferase [Verrucomicrobiae bacterium]|nr:acyltransferase [Verrucomicrobiae bacterium]